MPKRKKYLYKIEFLSNTFGCGIGKTTRVVAEDKDNIYYYDGFGRWCYLEKSLENEVWKKVER